MAQYPFNDSMRAVKLPGHPVVAGLQIGPAHFPGLENHIVKIVVCPVPVQDPAFHGVEPGRARQRRKDGYLNDVHFQRVQHIQGLLKHFN